MPVARLALIVSWFSMVWVAGIAPVSAETRVALVIGNGAYVKAGRLANPANDAHAIAGMLRAAGFDRVDLHQDLGIRELRQVIGDFADTVRSTDSAVVYYAGHGIEVNGVNYLIPTDAVLNRDIDVPYEAYSVENLVQVLEPARRLRLVMLDACRDNPFVRSMKRSVGKRTVGRGLAAVEPVSVNTVIAFAAKAGSFAIDGEGSNSPYAAAILNNLATPGLDLRIAFGRVRDEVLKVTNNRQEPFLYGSLGGAEISIFPGSAGGRPQAPASTPIAPFDRAAQVWMVTKDTASIAVLEDFLKQFGNTPYGSLARARLDELKRSGQATSVPPQLKQRPAGPADDSAKRAWAVTQNTTSVAVLEDFIRQFDKTPYGSMARARLQELKRAQIAKVNPDKVEPPKKSRCPSISGTWSWTGGLFGSKDVVFGADGSARHASGISGTWSCSDGLYIIDWKNWTTDRVRLSEDGKKLNYVNGGGGFFR